jgi:hypothetical protein
LVGVESPKGADETHPVGFITEVIVGWGDRDGAQVSSDCGKRATDKCMPQVRVLPEEGLLGGVVVSKDGWHNVWKWAEKEVRRRREERKGTHR